MIREAFGGAANFRWKPLVIDSTSDHISRHFERYGSATLRDGKTWTLKVSGVCQDRLVVREWTVRATFPPASSPGKKLAYGTDYSTVDLQSYGVTASYLKKMDASTNGAFIDGHWAAHASKSKYSLELVWDRMPF